MADLLLTGERGYLGSTVAECLTRAGVDFAILPDRLEQLAPGSLSCRRVLHCAGALAHRSEDWQSANVLGTERLLAALPKDAELIFLSSRSVYDPQDPGPLTEDSPARPGTGYGASKLAAEMAVRASGRACVILRVSTLFGVSASGSLGEFNFPAQALRALTAGRPVQLFTPDRACDFLDVLALAKTLAAMAGRPLPRQAIYNVAGRPRSLHTMIEALAAVVRRELGQETKLNYQAGPPPRTAVISSTRFETEWGALPQRPDEEVFVAMLRSCCASPAP